MNQNKQINLIEGFYSAEDAEEILNSLIFSNVNYLQLKNLRTYEMHGKIDEISLIRIQELKKTAEKTRYLIEEAKANNHKLHISSDIHIALE